MLFMLIVLEELLGTFLRHGKNSQPRHVNKTSNHETQWPFRCLDQITSVDE